MPALPPAEIVRIIEDAFTQAGCAAVLVSGIREHPRCFHISTGEGSFPVWIFIWTLTHGGGSARPVDEYRIQLTSVTPPLPENPDGPTLLIGYDPSIECFSGFDMQKHRNFSTHSPSIQVNINVLRYAARDGFAFARKSNDEIVIGFRPDNILAYALNCERLHEIGTDVRELNLLSKIGRFETVTNEEIGAIPSERQRIISRISRFARDSNFRRNVTNAYGRKCCVTGIQLRLVDAAHILPVGARGSTDDVQNGLCLSPTYHRAYDRGLILLCEDYRMILNPHKRDKLIQIGIADGLSEFESFLGGEIILPSDRRQWPDPKFIRAANRLHQP